MRETIPLAVNCRIARWAAVGATLLIFSPAFAFTARDFDGRGVTLTQERYKGREAVKVVEANSTDGTADTIAILKGALFQNGTIEVWVAGAPIDDTAAAGGARGFVGNCISSDRSLSLRRYLPPPHKWSSRRPTQA
jgi:hypothetical protein